MEPSILDLAAALFPHGNSVAHVGAIPRQQEEKRQQETRKLFYTGPQTKPCNSTKPKTGRKSRTS